MSITMQDIADLAGVSRPAVSAVLTGRGNTRVSKETRERILFCASQLHYKPNINAQRLKCPSQSKRIGIMYYYCSDTLRFDLYREINQLLQFAGWDAVFYPYPLLADKDISSRLNDFIEFDCRGVIAIGCEVPPETGWLPLVTAELDMTGDIRIDKRYGQYLSTRHLLEHGHRRIGYLYHNLERVPTQKAFIERRNGYFDALREYGIDPSGEFEINSFWNESFVDELTDLVKKKKVTALVCHDDRLAARLIKLLRQMKIKVPEELALTGFDGAVFTEFSEYSITTVVQPLKAQAAALVQRMLGLIDGSITGQEPPVILKPYLVIGESCGCQSQMHNYLEWEAKYTSLDFRNQHLKPINDGAIK